MVFYVIFFNKPVRKDGFWSMTGLQLGCWLAMWLYGGFSMQNESLYQSEKLTSL